MTDSKLRELERQWKETGSAEDEAAWLKARMKAGELEQSKLDLAAYCGHQGARAALELPASATDWQTEARRNGTGVSFDSFAQSVDEANEIAARLVLSIARARLKAPGSCKKRDRKRLAELLAVVEDWLRDQSEHEGAVAEAAEEAHSLVTIVRGDTMQHPLVRIIVALEIARTGNTGAGLGWLQSNSSALLLEEREAVASELVPWALGYSDPVRERVEARRRTEVENGG